VLRLAVLGVLALLFTACEPELGPAVVATRPATLTPTATRPPAPPDVVCEWATVLKVTDGDTIRVSIDGGPADVPVRYIGIDTPETVHPTLGVQPFGPEASEANRRLVASVPVCLERDVSETDRFERLLRYVWLADGTLVNEALVAQGLAVTDTVPPDVKHVERFLSAQRTAAAEGLGLWAP